MENLTILTLIFFICVCDFESEGLMILVLTSNSCTFLRV